MTIDLPDDLALVLKAASKHFNTSQKEVISHALRVFLHQPGGAKLEKPAFVVPRDMRLTETTLSPEEAALFEPRR